MKKIIFLAIILATVFGGNVWAEGEYVLPGGGTGTKITSLPYTILNPGFYYFGGSLSINLSGSNNVITVAVDNVTLDLMGCSLINTNPAGPAGYGIRMIGRKNVTIRNGTVVNFSEGIWESSTSGANHRMINMRLNHNGDAIYVRGKNHLVQDCTASKNYVGIWIDSGTIRHCVACDNTNIGIRLPEGGSVIGNVANNNANHNFFLGTASTTTYITVNRNSASGLDPNYYKPSGSSGVLISALNAGTP